jgi:hypothetical protein
MNPFSVRTNAQIGELIAASGAEAHELARTVFDEPIWMAKLGGDKLPAIVLTAGSHADEVAGVFAGLQFIQSLKTDHAVYIVPMRDPNGWNGFSLTLQRVTGEPNAIMTYAEAAAVLRAGDVYYDDGALIIARINDTVFATEPTSLWTSTQITRHKLPALLAEDKELAAKLAGKRLVLPGNTAVEDGRHPYAYGGHTAYVGDGFSAHFNRFFDRDDAPIEVSAVRDLVDRVRPGLTIDLHEGFSTGYYLFIHSTGNQELIDLSKVMIDAVRDSGGRIATREELEPVWGPRTAAGILTLGDGMFTLGPPSSNARSSFAGYCEEFGYAITTEPGMEAEVPDRVRMIDVGARAVIDRFISLHA